MSGEFYWDNLKNNVYRKQYSSKVGPQHEKVVLLIPANESEQNIPTQQFTESFFNELTRNRSIENITSLKQLNNKLHDRLF